MDPLTGIPERYRIDEMLSRRAFARAYRATDQMTGDTLVLKSLRYPTWFSTNERIFHQKRAARSLQAAARARHPACASVYAVEEAPFSLFVAREWVNGRPLSRILEEQGRLPGDEIARIARSCAGALDSLAEADLEHGALTTQNLILCDDGSVRVTDPRFSDEAARFEFAGARCDLGDRRYYGSDISALAEILLTAIDGLHGASRKHPPTARMVAALKRAQKDSRVYANAASLADALTSLSSAQIVRHVWRPATATGLMAAFGTVCVLAVSEEAPSAKRHAPSHRPARVARHIQALAPAPADNECPAYESLSPEDRSWLSLVVRRQGVAALTRPTIAAFFKLDAAQQIAVAKLLSDQRDRLATMVEQAASGGGKVVTSDFRQMATESIVDLLRPAQKQLWMSLAGQEPAQGEPVL